MEITREISATRDVVARARAAGKAIRFVPTMGALHVGHTSLMDAARRNGGFVVVSIFVNPTQFGPNEDFARYPRDEAGDLKICEDAGVDLVFLPPTDAMYPCGAVTSVRVAQLTDTLCGAHRSGHFDGVATIVSKLFNIIQPDAAYFGQKDAQQLAVLRRMARDLDFPVEIVGCPTVRELDGLAVSSRNAYLTPDERRQAPSLRQALLDAKGRIEAGERDAERLVCGMRAIIDAAGPARIDYISVVDADTLQPVDEVDSEVLIALAVEIGKTRLIDNVQVDPSPTRG